MKRWIAMLLCLTLLGSVCTVGAMAASDSDVDSTVYLSDIEWQSWKMFGGTSEDANPPYRPSRDCNEAGGTLTIAGVEYEKGLRTHPGVNYDAEFVYDISPYNAKTFSAVVGKDSAGSAGNVKFLVKVDGEVKAESPLVPFGESYELTCDVTGGKKLTLLVNAGDDGFTGDSAAFGNARLIGCSETVPEDVKIVTGTPGAWLPITEVAAMPSENQDFGQLIEVVNNTDQALDLYDYEIVITTSRDGHLSTALSAEKVRGGFYLAKEKGVYVLEPGEVAVLRVIHEEGQKAYTEENLRQIVADTEDATPIPAATRIIPIDTTDSAVGFGEYPFVRRDGVCYAMVNKRDGHVNPLDDDPDCGTFARIYGQTGLGRSQIYGDAPNSNHHKWQADLTATSGSNDDNRDMAFGLLTDEQLAVFTGAVVPENHVYLSDMEWQSWKMFGGTSEDANPPYKPSRDCNEAGGTLTIAGKEYAKGLRTHPDPAYPAEIVYDISDCHYTTFSATVGKDSAATYGYGYTQVQIFVDGELRAISPRMEVGDDCYLACDVTGAKTLRLVATDGGDAITHDSVGFGNAMLDNRAVNISDTHMQQYLTDLQPTSMSEGVTVQKDEKMIELNSSATVSYTYADIYKYLYLTAKNPGEQEAKLKIALGDAIHKTIVLAPGEEKDFNLSVSVETVVTLTAEEGSIAVKDARVTLNKENEPFTNPAKPAGTTRETYNGWLADLSTLPVSFVYEGEKNFGLGGKNFTETERKTATTETAEQTVVKVKHLPSGVDITLDTLYYPDYDAYEWTLYFTNNTGSNTGIFSDVRGAEMYFYGSNPVLSGLNADSNGGSSSEYYTEYETPVTNEIYKEATTGKPTFQVFPYYKLTTDDGGAFIAVSWGGRYYNRFTPVKESEDTLRFTAGQLDLETYLAPGETMRTPLVAVIDFDKTTTKQQATNLWRQWFIHCNMNQPNGELMKPMVTASSSWFYSCMTTADEQSQLDAIKAYLENGVLLDYWWMDAGWYYGPNESTIDTWTNTGIWKVDTDRFPSAFQLVSAYAKAHDMEGTILWFEPERSALTAEQIRTVFPEFKDEWLLHDTKFGVNEHSMLNIGNAECRQWIFNIVADIMATGDISIYRQDFNWLPYSLWQSYDEYGRTGITENIYIQGYYAYFDALLERFPGLIIDTCASGGNRLELETLRRAVPLHRTDYNVDYYNCTQAASQALYNWIPFSGQPANQAWNKEIDVYSMRSIYAPSITLNFDYRNANLNWDLLTALVEECRMVTKYWADDYYELLPWNNSDAEWRGWQFFDAANDEGVIQLFCPEGATELNKTIRLYGLNPDVTYVLTDVSGTSSTTATGRELMDNGFQVRYGNSRSSSVIFINTKEVQVPDGIYETKWKNMSTLPEGAVVVSDLPYESWKMYFATSEDANPQYTPSFNCNESGGLITMGYQIFPKGIRSHPHTDGTANIVYDISSYSNTYTKFATYVGKETTSGNAGQIAFQIIVDGKVVADSGIMQAGESKILTADITGGSKLTLQIHHGNDGITNDSAAFGNAVLLTEEQLDKYIAIDVDVSIGAIACAADALAAKLAYNALSKSQKALVTELPKLEQALAKWNILPILTGTPGAWLPITEVAAVPSETQDFGQLIEVINNTDSKLDLYDYEIAFTVSRDPHLLTALGPEKLRGGFYLAGEKGTHVLEPGEVAVLWVVFDDSQKAYTADDVRQIVSAAQDASPIPADTRIVRIDSTNPEVGFGEYPYVRRDGVCYAMVNKRDGHVNPNDDDADCGTFVRIYGQVGQGHSQLYGDAPNAVMPAHKKFQSDLTATAGGDNPVNDNRGMTFGTLSGQQISIFINTLTQNENIGKVMDNLIDTIGTVTLQSEALILEIRAAFDALTQEQKALVAKENVLTAAENRLQELKKEQEDKEAAKAVDDLIDAIGTVTLESEKAIADARTAYDALTDDQKPLVTKLETLTTAEATFAQLKEQADKAAAKAVDDLIDAIGTVTLESEKAITDARTAYDALTDAQKNFVEKLEVLTAAEKRLQELIDDQNKIVYGDVNGDGTIDAIDALIVLKASVGKQTLNETETKTADVDGNGKLDAVDALWILKKSVKKVDRFPVEESL